MSYLHAIVGAAWIYLAFAAICTAGVKVELQRRLRLLADPASFDTPGVFAGLVLAAVFPLMWLVSAAIHIGNTGLTRTCCQWLLAPGVGWREASFLAAAVSLVGYQLYSLLGWWRDRHGSHGCSRSDEIRGRVNGIIDREPTLRAHADCIRLVDCSEQVCAVRGLLRPTVEIADGLAEQLDDGALRAALLHEVAHLRHRDPLREFAGAFARVFNPFARWLDDEFRAWRFAREIGCDRAAVDAGAHPTHLADAIVTAARAQTDTRSGHCHLCGRDASRLEARIGLLLSTGEATDHRCPEASLKTFGCATIAALLVPHVIGGQLLQLHCLIEHLLW